MGSVSELCGMESTEEKKEAAKETVEVQPTAQSLRDILKQAFKAGDEAAQRQYDFLKMAEELGEEPKETEAVDESAAEIAMEEGPDVVGEEPEEDEGETELIEELIRAISDPTELSDEDENATLMAAEAVENAEKEAGINAPTVADYLSMRMGW